MDENFTIEEAVTTRRYTNNEPLNCKYQHEHEWERFRKNERKSQSPVAPPHPTLFVFLQIICV
jgi:hypothetical protein